MSEVYITVEASFENEEDSKAAAKAIKSALKKYDNDLTKVLNSINPIKNYDAYNELNVEEIKCKNNTLTIISFTGSSEPPVWFSYSIYTLGAGKIIIREQHDEGGKKYYFLNGERVTKKEYDEEKAEKPLLSEDSSTNNKLFLPEGRVSVKATLDSYWLGSTEYDDVIMRLTTDNGAIFYYKGSGQLTNLIDEDSLNTCEFSGIFEKGKLKGEEVSFVKRLSKIKIEWKT